MSNKSKLTLIVDGNWLLMSRMSVLNNKYDDDVKMCNELKLMLIRSINVVLRQFPVIDNIIFVADGGSWRNDLEIPEFLVNNKLTPETLEKVKVLLKEYVLTHPLSWNIDDLNIHNCTIDLLKQLDDFDMSSLDIDQVEYKGTRQKSSEINWQLIFESYEEFTNTISSTGITVSKEPNIEGDDWAWYWSRKLNSEGTNCIIWTKDKDLTQLVSIDSNKCFTIWWNKDSGVIAPEYSEADMDFLFNSEFSKNEELLQYICNRSKEVTHIDPKYVIIDKIIRGDGSDNIIPCVLRRAKSETSTKLYKVTTKELNYNLNIHDDNEIREYFTNLLTSKNYIGRVLVSVNQAVEHFKYNTRLVVLERESYPEHILQIMESYDTYNCNKNINKAESILSASANSIQSILEII